jgi:ribonuclease PH
VDGAALLDLQYTEDSRAEVDMNVAMTDAGAFVEVQGTAEARPFDRSQLDRMLGLAELGIDALFAKQRAALDVGHGG